MARPVFRPAITADLKVGRSCLTVTVASDYPFELVMTLFTQRKRVNLKRKRSAAAAVWSVSV
jgi:hypothetical protein